MRCGQSLLRSLTTLTLSLALWASCTAETKAQLIITHVNVIPMTDANLILPGRDVVIRNGRINAIRDSAPNSTTSHETVDGRGKWLIPGLTDGHMHVLDLAYTGVSTSDVYLPYLANGVLQVVNLQAQPKGIEERKELSIGKAVGPQLMVARMIDGSPPIWPDSIVATTPEEGRAAVRRIQAEGYDLVKVYTRLNLETFTAIIAEARMRNIKMVGHLPLRNRAMTEELLQPGFGMVAHAEEYFYQGPDRTDATIARFAALAKRSGTPQLLGLFAAAGLTPRTALRETKSPASELGLLNSDVTGEAILSAMIEHPILVNRPIVCAPKGVRLCRPSETGLDLLDRLPPGPFYKEDGEILIDQDGRRVA